MRVRDKAAEHAAYLKRRESAPDWAEKWNAKAREKRKDPKVRSREREQQRRWRERNPTYSKEWRAKPEQREKEHERSARWARDNLGKRRDNEAKRRAQKRSDSVEAVDSSYVYRCYRGCCGICGDPLPVDSFHLDHIVPLSKGGLHRVANLQPAHAKCNLAKWANWPTIGELEAPGTRELTSQGESTAVSLGCYSAGETLIKTT